MISVRKRKMMLKKLHAFFENRGKFLTEREYKAAVGAPYRLALITKYLGGYHRLRYYMSFYYPQWKEDAVVEEKPSTLESLRTEKDDKKEDDSE